MEIKTPATKFRAPDIRGKNAGIRGVFGCVMRNIRCISFRPDFHSNPPPMDRIGPPGGSECCKNFSPTSGALKLLGPKHRGTYRPSAELSGTVMQVLDYNGG